MSHYTPEPQPAYVPDEEPKTKRRKLPKGKRLAAIIGIPVLMFTSCGIGTAMAGGSSEASGDRPEPETVTVTETATPEPAPTVTETAEASEPEVVVETETVTEEVEVEVIPDECTTALNEADELIDVYSEALILSSEAMTAAYEGDVAGLTRITEDLDRLNNTRLTPGLSSYMIDAATCRGEW